MHRFNRRVVADPRAIQTDSSGIAGSPPDQEANSSIWVITNIWRQRSTTTSSDSGDASGSANVFRQVEATGSSKWPVTRTSTLAVGKELTEGSSATSRNGAPTFRVSPTTCRLKGEQASHAGSGADGQSATPGPVQRASTVMGVEP
jgi:hypothetical protein